jgi:hypothetical protein
MQTPQREQVIPRGLQSGWPLAAERCASPQGQVSQSRTDWTYGSANSPTGVLLGGRCKGSQIAKVVP